ncbi:MAG: Uma2 family endonuclease [Moraxellaceae bacterium]|nr:Uma2 family endonuclease [Pseudomonadales bacterium]MCB1673665.1 Uma2 family endonuclease [Pseudomonadales bacterium]MCP5173844.1 Uma2 family endonuclease [Moraxellaceae bacterium]MCP5176838.1 Uma2 family endonuclease [Moraxellaceae bacterium]HQV23318.1 Uma2 family endonuclease [Agitococcus sp.]
MAATHSISLISEAEYLAGEKISPIKHEYIEGYVYAMAGAHANHNTLTLNIGSEFRSHLKATGKPCRAYMSDMKVRLNQGSKYYYPDVLVNCPAITGYFTENPLLIVEVLSDSTRRIDETEKRLAYIQLESLEEYVLIAQDFVQINVFRKRDGWRPTTYFLGDEVSFESIGLSLAVTDIYDGVDNDDMREWLKQNKPS